MTPRQQLTAAAELDPSALTREQLQGWNCVLCGARLAVDQSVGTVTITRGATQTTYEVWACAPGCVTGPAPQEPTEWARFLDHAMACADCTDGERCATGNQLHDAVRAALDTATP
ncbi:hypothetical protein [Streptomyces rapamycinicus]|uniref:Uncharacterized protein n=2 Tax=Streptomyces rapamycinicus TaxID=1226757 RepID=A0A0A0NG33_STRRN|nr:hypothetical protein [Streptomyces rapamycinicus]AGP56201.1 hypothetical protein M271_23455 [Streptomyces rapamycinicus NRRL 5491]MBB4783810.1 hypothetical protein [Streptomyces rapamycinicus]RLV80718.1 hypothetical protein D3C57_120075 [Streptomyces rapamycinicus NRRL 5491]UTO64167.1 hypothetical protein LJB45_18745 [Streptomyces rapamycinicus]UTP32122.1 hypothetical protein LIV37_23865 [Streptomyces rapamycinicus NRRL 5491]